VFSIGGIFALFLSKLPETVSRPQFRPKASSLPTAWVWQYLLKQSRLILRKIWHFILEAKDLSPAMDFHPVDKVKQAFKIRIRTSEREQDWLPEVSNSLPDSGRAQSPEEVYLETIKRDPQNREAYEGLGRLYLQEKKFEDAAETFDFLTKFDPSRDIYWSNLGLSLYSLKKFREAANAYEKALNLNSKIPTRWINLGLCFAAMEDLGKAVTAVRGALNLDRRNLHYLTLLADLYIQAGNGIKAEQALEQILEIEPTSRAAREKLMKLKI